MNDKIAKKTNKIIKMLTMKSAVFGKNQLFNHMVDANPVNAMPRHPKVSSLVRKLLIRTITLILLDYEIDY